MTLLVAMLLVACGGAGGPTDGATDVRLDELPDAVAVPDVPPDPGREAAQVDVESDGDVGSPLPAWGSVNGWILLDRDPVAIADAIERAAAYGVNHVQLSHDIVMNVEDLLGDDPSVLARVDTINAAIEQAHQRGMEAWIWAHELSGVGPAACYEPGGDLWQSRARAYREGLARIPGLDGVVLMFGSAPMPPWLTLCTCGWCKEGWPGASALEAPPPAERLRMVLEQVGGVLTHELHKKLIARVFVHEPQENAWHADGLAAVAGVDFTAMHKGVVQDWQPYNPFDPTQGHVGPHPAVVELDVAGEYWGLSELPFCAPGFFRHLLRHAGENGAVGSVTRVQRGSASALGTPNEVNLRAVNAFLKDPDTSLGAIWEAELGARYGLTRSSAGFARIKRTLQDTFEIRLKSHYVLGIWALDKGSDLPDSAALGELDGRGKMPKWDADWQERWDRLDRPDRAVVLDVWQEAGEAVALADEGLLAIKTLSGVLPDEPWNDLHRRLKHQYAAARAWRAVKLFVWAQRAQKLHPEDADLSAWMAWAHLELGGIRDRMIADGLTDVRVASPARIDEFLGNTASLLSPVVGAQRPPAAPFLPLRAFPQRTPEAADLVLGATRPIRASLDTGTEIPDYGTVVVLDGLGPDERTRVALDHLSPSSRHVLRLRAIVDGVEVHGGDTWLFTPAACACTADDLCLDGQCVPRDTCVPDCYGRCPGDEDGCGGVCLQNECTGCCAGVLCLEDPTGEFCP